MTRSVYFLISFAAASWIAASCAAQALSHSHWTRLPTDTIPPPVSTIESAVTGMVQQPDLQRIVVLPFENRTRHGDFAEQARTALTHALSQCDQLEIVSLQDGMLPACLTDFVWRGRFSEYMLIDMSHRYNADAVMVGSINAFDPYGKPSLGLTAHVVDVRTAEVVASVDGYWSTDNRQTQQAFQAFLAYRHEQEYQHRLYAQSPTAFAEFVMEEVAAQLTGGGYPDYRKEALEQSARPGPLTRLRLLFRGNQECRGR